MKPDTILWLDDVRDPKNFGMEGAIWIKTFSDFENTLHTLIEAMQDDNIVHISFDNDLGTEEEGYDGFCILEEYLHMGYFEGLKKITVHSSNPSAVHKFMLVSRAMKAHFDIDLLRTPL